MAPAKGILVGLVATVAALLMVSAPLFAHHGAAAFDVTKMVTVKGTVTDFQHVNPHVQVYFESKNDKGETEVWPGELTAPNKLSRAGWTKHTLETRGFDHGGRKSRDEWCPHAVAN